MFSKRSIILPAIILALWVSVFSVASAHVLKTDGNIGAIMHVDPDDDPIAGQATNFFFELKDKTGKFKSQDCDCKATIFLGDKQLYQASPFQNNGGLNIDTPVFSFTFPQKAVYRVELSGNPLTAGEFQNFNLKYDVRVDRQVDSNQQSEISNQPPTNHGFHYFIFGGGFIAILILYLFEKRKNNRAKKKTKGVIMPLLAAIAVTGFFIHGSMLDTATCLHDHPVMHDHQCCAAPQAITVSTVSLHTQSVLVKVEVANFVFQQKEFSLQENNKSPPIII